MFSANRTVNELANTKRLNSRNLFRGRSAHTTTKVVQLHLLRILTGIIVACCLIVTGTGSAPIDPARATSLEANTESESRSSSKSTLQQLQQSPTTAPGTNIHINVSANGSAVWTIQYRFQLADPNETAAFDQLRDDIAANPSQYRSRFKQRMSQALTTAEHATGREMTISNVSVRAARDGTTGTMTYEFVWQKFATTDGTRLGIGDLLAGFSLDNETQLTISWPTSYEPVTVRPAPTERQANAMVWSRATEFTEREPIVELARSNSTTNTTTPEAAGGANRESASGSNLPLSTIGLIALVALVGGFSVFWLVRRRQHDDTLSTPTDSADHSELDHEIPSEDALTTPNGGTQDSTSPESDDQSVELLSNEEQVVEVLRQSGGRAKQQQIVTELGWTDAKTSSVVSRLRDDGTIEGFRLGRENVLHLPDEATEDTTDNPRNDE